MPTATYRDDRTISNDAEVFSVPDLLNQVMSEGVGQGKRHQAKLVVQPPVDEQVAQSSVAYQPRPRTRIHANDERKIDWFHCLGHAACFGLFLVGLLLFYRAFSASWDTAIATSPVSAPSASIAGNGATDKQLQAKPIEEIRVGDRLAGRNPLREQTDLVEPNPATWRKISLYMTKEDGLGLWIVLLRPITWIEERHAKPGNTIFIELHEMGAVGDAEVTDLAPCPEIKSGSGTVVTGTFKHQADANSRVVHLQLEDQLEFTGVTDNHPYWSKDRQEFVEVGDLRNGELVDTEFGSKRVLSIRPIEHDGFLYNLETTEHVYRVGSLGTLVHNNCVTGSIRGKTPNKVARDILTRQPTWRKIPSERGHGWRIIDENGIERMRYMYPQKTGFPHERTGYFVRQDELGRYLDIDGAIIPNGPDQITLRHIFDTSL